MTLVRNKVVHDQGWDKLLDHECRFVLDFVDENNLGGDPYALQSRNDFGKVIRAAKSLELFLRTKISCSSDMRKPNLRNLIGRAEHLYSPKTIENMNLIATRKCLLFCCERLLLVNVSDCRLISAGQDCAQTWIRRILCIRPM